MEWTKIPTDLLQSRKSDKEILAITKYQLLWAMLERQPSDDICVRYMTSKQLQQARDYIAAIERRVNADIKSVDKHRNRQKMFYEKNQALMQKTDGQYDGHSDGQYASRLTPQIRLDKIREDKGEIYNREHKLSLSNTCDEHKDNFLKDKDKDKGEGQSKSEDKSNTPNIINKEDLIKRMGELIKKTPKGGLYE